ncbi:MAG: ThuA domain-containing protein [Opitutus sp.]|nr:ThuA domain-containing protein [Opitutus sp.]
MPRAVCAGRIRAGCAVARVVFTKSSGFEHSVIKWENGERSFAEKMLTKFGAEHELEFTFSKDGSLFSPEISRSSTW